MERHSTTTIELEILQDMLIIAFAYCADERRFTIISGYPERSPGSARDFVALVFKDVKRFHREPGDLPTLAHFKLSYATKDDVGTRESQDIESRDGEDGRQYVRFWFGPNFGGVAFEYGSLDVHRRGSRVVRTGGKIVYFDHVSMEEFEFDNPFPELLRVGTKDN